MSDKKFANTTQLSVVNFRFFPTWIINIWANANQLHHRVGDKLLAWLT